MIRPFTCLAFLLACGSGLYLYQSKHRVKLLDEQIEQTVKSTDAIREQTRMLSAEWTLLNDPERLRQLASQFLTLQTVSPNQFTSLADLDSRLPPPVPPGPPPGAVAGGGGAAPPGQVPAASDAGGGPVEAAGSPADAKLADAKPADARGGGTADAAPPASPSALPAALPKDVASPSPRGSPRIATAVPAEPLHSADRKSLPHVALAQPRPIAGQQGSPDQPAVQHHGAPPRNAEQRLAEVRPVVRVARVPASIPYAGGSLLGMAHGMSAPPVPLPLPRPMPARLPQWSTNAGG